jgi:hypothetical protein
MPNTSVIRFSGPTYLLSVADSSHTAVTIKSVGNDQQNYCSFLNTGAASVGINLAPQSAAAAVLPTDGGSSSTCSFVLPALMETPMIVAVPMGGAPSGQFSVTAIGTAAGPSSVFITMVGDQS